LYNLIATDISNTNIRHFLFFDIFRALFVIIQLLYLRLSSGKGFHWEDQVNILCAHYAPAGKEETDTIRFCARIGIDGAKHCPAAGKIRLYPVRYSGVPL
jgi:hypothetical protein